MVCGEKVRACDLWIFNFITLNSSVLPHTKSSAAAETKRYLVSRTEKVGEHHSSQCQKIRKKNTFSQC